MSTIGPTLPESAKPAEFIGTPLTGKSRSVANHDDPLKAAAGRFKQELKSGLVTDGRGGQRFHGAFHGGFSAGYFNTVGSIHGFTPASFKSSRNTGRSSVQQKPEDFMDEEDLEEHMQLGVTVKNQSLFSTTADEFAARSSEIAPGLITSAPIVRSIGIMLMQRMGWCRGDPIGKPRSQIRHYTVEPDPTVQQAKAAPKADVFGLGYVPYDDERLQRLPSIDDDDGHFTDKYDTSISFHDEDQVAITQKPKSKHVKERFPGYTLAIDDLSIVSPPSIQRLVIPRDWKPSACPVTETEIAPELERFRADIELVTKRRRRPLSLQERSEALGEEVAPAVSSNEPTSIFNMISSEAKAQLSKSLANMFHIGTTLAAGNTEDIPVHFPDDPSKQARFVQFLKVKRSGGDPASEPTRDWRAALELQQFETLASTLPAPVAVKQEPKVVSQSQIPTDFDSAAKLKMFGALTRETMDWVPARLLCKRFHVPDPYQGRAVPTPTVQKRTRFEDLLATVHPELVSFQNPVTAPVSLKEGKVKEEDEEEEEIPEKEERPPVDLFKAIFADSDDENEEEEPLDQSDRRSNIDISVSKKQKLSH